MPASREYMDDALNLILPAAGIRSDGRPNATDDCASLPEPLVWEELRKPVDYKNNLLGNRWLERGQGLVLYGPAGVGKSIACYQACAEWAAGLDGLHITPAFPLRIVILQTEDSQNDLREALAGVLSSSSFTSERISLVEKNLTVLPPVPGGDPYLLGRFLETAATKYKPDILHVNPLLAFCPGDPARDLGSILYQVVDPIIKRYSLGFFGAHHTTKTNNPNRVRYGVHDHQYLAAGDARIANWPRAMIQIEPVSEGLYLLRVTKRWQRTGWTSGGKPTNELYCQHSKRELRWIDATVADVTAGKTLENPDRIREILPSQGELGISRDRVHLLAKNRLRIGKNKADAWLKLAIEDGIVERIEKSTNTKRKEALFRCAKNCLQAT